MFPTVWTIAVCLWPILAFAGGLGFAPLIALVALAALIDRPSLKWRGYAVVLAAAFAFAFLSYFWSTWSGTILEFDPAGGKYAVKSSALRLALVAVSTAFVIAMARRAAVERLEALVRRSVIAGGAMIVIVVTLALFERPLIDLVTPLSAERAEVVQNVGRNAMLTAAAAPPVLAYIASPARLGPICALGVGAALFASGLLLGFYAAALALVAAGAAAVFVLRFPDRGFRILGYVTALAILVAPAIALLAIQSSNGVETTESAEVASAMWRLDMWRLTADLVAQKPVLGWGADAARSVDVVYAQGIYKGELILSVHPHNMPLHIWLELGFVGAGLTAVATALLGRSLPSPGRLGRMTAVASAGVWGACLLICAVSFSVWNAGWWAFVGFVLALLVMMHRYEREAAS